MKAILAFAAVVVAAAALFDRCSPSAGQAKGDRSPEGRANQPEKGPMQAGKPSSTGRWQMQIVQQQTVNNQRITLWSSHVVYLLDTQTGTLLKFDPGSTEPTQLYPKKK